VLTIRLLWKAQLQLTHVLVDIQWKVMYKPRVRRLGSGQYIQHAFQVCDFCLKSDTNDLAQSIKVHSKELNLTIYLFRYILFYMWYLLYVRNHQTCFSVLLT